MVAVLYLFLLALLAALRRELAAAAKSAEAAQPAGHLVVVDPGPTDLRPGQVLPLQTVTSLGRDPENTVVLADSAVSGRHAVLTLRGGAWWVRDLGSTNGTLLGQRRLTGEAPVEPGEVIGLGRVRLKLVE